MGRYSDDGETASIQDFTRGVTVTADGMVRPRPARPRYFISPSPSLVLGRVNNSARADG